MRSLFITLCYASFFIVGVGAPFVFTLGYLWVDSFFPQALAISLINDLPVSLIAGIAALGGYFLLDRRDPPRVCFITVLLVLFAAWVTLSTFAWAVVPIAAVGKWNGVVKTLLFTAFIPLVIRSRIQIEAFLQIWLFGFAINFLPLGLKSLISGGAYGRDLSVTPSGTGAFSLGSDARTATLALMLVPIALFLRQHTKILPAHWLTSAMYLTIILIAFGAAYGTYERTALVVAAVLAALLWLKSRRKVLLGAALAVVTLLGAYLAPGDWMERMGTITEASHESRLEVWQWTFDYALEHPLGGGFEVHRIDGLGGVNPDGSKAGLYAHNDFFEVLGEQGWLGLTIFLALIATSVFYLRGAARRARRFPHLAWCRDLATALQIALVVQLTGGSFVALAYHSPLYMIFALSVSLREYVYRVEKASERTMPSVSRLAERGLASSAHPSG
jgi:probable O-glycosylation ligase (exosortase A-associated)